MHKAVKVKLYNFISFDKVDVLKQASVRCQVLCACTHPYQLPPPTPPPPVYDEKKDKNDKKQWIFFRCLVTWLSLVWNATRHKIMRLYDLHITPTHPFTADWLMAVHILPSSLHHGRRRVVFYIKIYYTHLNVADAKPPPHI